MVCVKPFKGLRPKNELASKVSALPYDVMNRAEAKEMAKDNDASILHVTRAEIDFDESVGDYDDCVYEHAAAVLRDFQDKGILIQDEKPVYYIYRQKMGNRYQTGIVGCVASADYENGVVLKHELTRKEKEADRIRHFDVCNCHTEPVFLTYHRSLVIDEVISLWQKQHEPLFDFTSDDGIGHTLWLIDDSDLISRLEQGFAGLERAYIADGHHRTASATAIRKLRMEQNGELSENDAANYFMAVLFPADDLAIMAYHRIVDIPQNFSVKEFFTAISAEFDISESDTELSPTEKHLFGLYYDGKWYAVKAKEALYAGKNEVESLDAAILQKYVLEPYFGIEDPRTDSRIDFIGGIRGTAEIVRRSDAENRLGFSLCPVDIEDLMKVADAGLIMPPKSTWFEPKLRSGLFLHPLD